MSEPKKVSVWDYKPWWCQPWSIFLTGIALIGGSWFLFEKYWLTGLVAVPIGIWMGFFILIYPRLVVQSGLLAELNQVQDLQAIEPDVSDEKR
jgi:hypothetical protein